MSGQCRRWVTWRAVSLGFMVATAAMPSTASTEPVRLALYADSVQLLDQTGQPIPVSSWTVPGRPIVLQWMGSSDGLDQLQNLYSSVERPADALRHLRQYALELRAAEGDRHPVLARPAVFVNADGLETHVMPGVPVYEAGGQWFFGHPDWSDLGAQIQRAGAHGDELGDQLTVAAELVDTTFVATGLADHMETVNRAWCPLDGGLLPPSHGCVVPGAARVIRVDAKVYRLRELEGVLLGLVERTPWLYQEIRLQPSSAHATQVGVDGGVEGGVVGGVIGGVIGADMSVSGGSAVYWTSGGYAGKTRYLQVFLKDDLSPHSNQRKCTQVSSMELANAAGIPPVTLCFEQSAIWTGL